MLGRIDRTHHGVIADCTAACFEMKKQKIPVSSSPGVLTGNPFAQIGSPLSELDTSVLPPGPETVIACGSTPGFESSIRVTGEVILRRETAHRGGKVVTVAGGFDAKIREQDLDTLAREAKAHCGTGGTRREREIEIQGEQAARLRSFFQNKGFRVRGVS